MKATNRAVAGRVSAPDCGSGAYLRRVGAILASLVLAVSCDDEPGVLPVTLSSVCDACHVAPASGSHPVHVGGAGYYCTVCHYGYDSSPTHQNDVDETMGLIAFDAGNPAGTYDEGTSSCSSLYCHGPATVDWGDSPPVCGDCHVVPPTSGSHVVHIGNDFSDPSAPEHNFACSECHKGAGDGTALHVNFTVDVVLDPSATSLATGYGANGGNIPTWNAGPGTCTNVYCHSNGVTKEKGGVYGAADIGSPPDGTLSYAVPVWGGTVLCGDCHSGASLNAIAGTADYPASGAHRWAQHTVSNVVGYTYVQCFWCHATGSLDTRQGTYGTSLHVDGALEFSPHSTISGGTMWPDSLRTYDDGHCGSAGCGWY